MKKTSKEVVMVPETAHDDAKRVLFVCTGNTCRSPMAAALLNDRSRPREICSACGESRDYPCYVATSAGLYAQVGAPISPNAVTALANFGIPPLLHNNYSAHRARPVSEELLADADVVVAITSAHAMELIMRYPNMASKITTFESDVPDPFGGSPEVYRACLFQLSHCIDRLFFGEEEQA